MKNSSEVNAPWIGWLWISGFSVVFLWAICGVLLYGNEQRGTFGDMFGAVNALFTGLAFAVLIYTVWLQRVELSDTRKELKGQKEELEKQNSHMASQVEAARDQLVRWDKDYIVRNKPVVFCDRWEHPDAEGNYHYVIRNVGGGFAVNVYFVEANGIPLALGSLAPNTERRLPKRAHDAVHGSVNGLRHVLLAEGPFSRTTQWTPTLNYRTPEGDIRQGHVQHRIATVKVPPPRGQAHALREYLDNNFASFLEQLQTFGESDETWDGILR